MQTLTLTPLYTGLSFGEGPRWHNDALWLSDIAAHAILSLTADGKLSVEHKVDFAPSGLGWLADGSLLVSSMQDHCVKRWSGNGFQMHADLSDYCGGKLNDMVVDAAGRAYVGNLGFDIEHQPIEPKTTVVMRVDPDGSAREVADNVMCPNGMAITADGKTLIVGQSGTTQLLAFTRDANGDLSERRVYADVPQGMTFDGLCVDAEDAVWFASPISNEVVRVTAKGEITHRVDTGSQHAIACMLGGADRRTLFVITAATLSIERAHGTKQGAVGTARVEVPGAGWP